MKKSLVLLALVLLVAVPAMAARVQVLPIVRGDIDLFQAYPGDSGATNVAQDGLNPAAACDVITAVPGVLSIIPGDNWANFVAAANASPVQAYDLKNVTLCKTIADVLQCDDVFNQAGISPDTPVCQHGTNDIRLWWALMYEPAGTTWQLKITYGTPVPWDDDGAGGNPAGYVHTDLWNFKVVADAWSLRDVVNLFHELPFGLDEVPLISNELLIDNDTPVVLPSDPTPRDLNDIIDDLQAAFGDRADPLDDDLLAAGDLLEEFELLVMDNCIYASPGDVGGQYGLAGGIGTGIAQTEENPACCKLLTDAEYIGLTTGALEPAK